MDRLTREYKKGRYTFCPIQTKRCPYDSEQFCGNVCVHIKNALNKLAKAEGLAETYGINLEIMLELAKSQIETASENVRLQEEITEYEDKIERGELVTIGIDFANGKDFTSMNGERSVD